MLTPIAQHRVALAWTMGGGMLVCPHGHVCQVMPRVAWGRSYGWVGSLCPPVLQLQRGRKHH